MRVAFSFFWANDAAERRGDWKIVGKKKLGFEPGRMPGRSEKKAPACWSRWAIVSGSGTRPMKAAGRGGGEFAR